MCTNVTLKTRVYRYSNIVFTLQLAVKITIDLFHAIFTVYVTHYQICTAAWANFNTVQTGITHSNRQPFYCSIVQKSCIHPYTRALRL